MAKGSSGSATDAVASIARYLRARPGASDTAPGITRHWLKLDPSPANVAAVEQALEQLARDGVVERKALPDGGAVYRRKPR